MKVAFLDQAGLLPQKGSKPFVHFDEFFDGSAGDGEVIGCGRTMNAAEHTGVVAPRAAVAAVVEIANRGHGENRKSW